MSRLFLTLGALTALACGPPPEEPLRLGLVVWPPYELLYLARESGTLDSSRVRLVFYESPADVQADYLNGGLDAVALTAGYVVQFERVQPGQRIVYVLDESRGGDALVARADFPTIASLAGARVGYEPGPLGALVMRRALAAGDLAASEVRVMPLDVAEHRVAFERGEVDALITYEPVVSTLERAGGHVLFDSSQMPREIFDVVVAREGVVREHRDALRHVAAAFESARRLFEEQPRASADVARRRTGLDVEEYLGALERVDLLDVEANRALLSGEDADLLRALERAAALIAEGEGGNGGRISVESIPTTVCLPAVTEVDS